MIFFTVISSERSESRNLYKDITMITIQAKKHDNFSVEFKFGFEGKDKAELADFAVNSS